MFFKSWSRSWEFAKLSYSTLLDNKHLIVFPVISTVATILVLMSFLLPLEMTGTLDTWLAGIDSEAAGSNDPTMYVTAFLFYFSRLTSTATPPAKPYPIMPIPMPCAMRFQSDKSNTLT